MNPAITDYQKGLTARHICRKHGISLQELAKMLKENNIAVRSGRAQKLSAKQVLEIKKLIKQGFKNIDIAEQYGVVPSAISSIRLGRSWSHVDASEVFIEETLKSDDRRDNVDSDSHSPE